MNQASSAENTRPEDLNSQFVLTDTERQILEAQANEVIAQLQQSSDAWQHVERGLRQLAAQEMNEAAQITLGVVDKSLAQANTSVDASAIKQQLTQLEQRFQQIEPRQFPTQAKLFGFIPVPSPLPSYFAQYQAMQPQFNQLLAGLQHSQDALLRDNASLQQARLCLWEVMLKLNKYQYLVEYLLQQTESIDNQPHVQQTIVPLVKQKQHDILLQLLASYQSVLSFELMIKNNQLLFDVLERVSTSTLTVLQTAMITAQTLLKQQWLLTQITALQQSSSRFLQTNQRLLAQDEPSAWLSLQHSFKRLYHDLDTVDLNTVDCNAIQDKTL
jgi:uncharacterized protein YaaN involved in tellurite resistance